MSAPGPSQLLLLCLCAVARWHAASAAGAGGDATALFQGAVRAHQVGSGAAADDLPAEADPVTLVPDIVTETEHGPMVQTELGQIVGLHESSTTKDSGGYFVFKGIPYGDIPRRFMPPEAKRPWAPAVLEAKDWRPGCIGSGVPGKKESEDCLSLNIWSSPGGHKGMPVIIYLHGGMNQHGSADDQYRQGDIVVQSAEFPVIFVNINFRLGIFGWADLGDPAMPKNLGMQDQQMAMLWVQRHIQAFGGDPLRVTLMGVSEGAGAVVAHLVSPGSKGLFQQVSLQSPMADFASRMVDRKRTDYILDQLGCDVSSVVAKMFCLNWHRPEKIWSADWVMEDIVREVGTFRWFQEIADVFGFFPDKNLSGLPGYLGWHPVVDGNIVPGEPRELIAKGQYHKVPVLLTTTRNESMGLFKKPDKGQPAIGGLDILTMGLEYLLKPGDTQRVMGEYTESLRQNGDGGLPANDTNLLHMMITDKIWLCDVAWLAHDLATTGGDVRVGMFAHTPKWDPVGKSISKLCESGATCHASDLMYMLPQDPDRGGVPESMREEYAFALKYRDEFLAFVSGKESVWVPFDAEAEPITFTDAGSNHVVHGYRREQCRALDSSMGDLLPEHMKARSRHLSTRGH